MGNILFLPRIDTDLHGFVFSVASNALGIEAASFCSAAEKDIAESPTACRNAQRQFIMHNSQCIIHNWDNYKLLILIIHCKLSVDKDFTCYAIGEEHSIICKNITVIIF